MDKLPRVLLFGCIGVLTVCIIAYLFLASFLGRQQGRFERYVHGGRFDGGTPCLSPDRTTVVYSTPRTGRGDLYTVSMDGRNRTRRTQANEYEGDPCYAPDGKRIVYVRESDGIGHLWLMNHDGTGQRQLTHGAADDSEPSFSPDGATILFTRRFPRPWPSSDTPQLYLIQADGSRLRPLTPQGLAGSEGVFSRDGKAVFCVSGLPIGIWTLSVDGKVRKYLGPGASPAVSSRGSLMAFLSDPYNQSVWTMKADGSNRQQVYHSRAYKGRIRFTPNGQDFLFLEEPEGRGVGSICTIRVDGTGYRRIFSSP